MSPGLIEAYNEAWRRYRAQCLWNVRRKADPSPSDAINVARCLRLRGDMNARELAIKIEAAANAA